MARLMSVALTEDARWNTQTRDRTSREIGYFLQQEGATTRTDEFAEHVLTALADAGLLRHRPVRRAGDTVERERPGDIEQALRELVRLKDGPRDAAYVAAKDAAWQAARAALGDVGGRP